MTSEATTGASGAHGSLDGDLYEVFRQERQGGAMQHAGNLRAPDAELAGHYAREFYGRRQESVRLWVVPRAAVHVVEDADLLQPPLDRSFKKPAGYSTGIKEKLALARALAAEVDSDGTPGASLDRRAAPEGPAAAPGADAVAPVDDAAPPSPGPDIGSHQGGQR